ncbi:MAG: 50S ribosomal protein L13 [Dehalococcoidales bacterium]|nr:50S ribosomal protein L13 [Dehalococcoidales bacterium]
MKTYSAKPTDIKRKLHVIDAADETLGRLSSQVAILLMGKHKPIYTPNQDTGDFVTVINAEKVRVTGKKVAQKVYYRHSNYPGGLKSITLGKLMEQFPTRAIEYAVKGMLPHTRLGARMNRKLKVYAGPEYPNKPKEKTEKTKVKAEKPKEKTAKAQTKEKPKAKAKTTAKAKKSK